MSIFQLSLIFSLFCYVYGVDQIFSSSTTEPSNDTGSNVTYGVNRIIGGSPTSIKNYPYMISIQWRFEGSHRCGGTYILPRFILTAAHCVTRSNHLTWYLENPQLLLVIAGSTSLKYTSTWQVQNVDHITVHGGYNSVTMAHDIALLRIRKPFRITPYVTYVPLPNQYDSKLANKYTDKNPCVVVGWGKTSTSSGGNPSVLQFANVPLIPSSQCAKYKGYHHLLYDQICAGFDEGGVDACQGDSGGPLICNNIQVGIISWGLGCAEYQRPGVYSRTDVHLAWINRTIMRSHASALISKYLTIAALLMTVWMLGI